MKRFFMYLGTGIMVLASVSCKHETGEQKMTLPLIKTVAVGSLNSIDRVEYMGIIGSEQGKEAGDEKKCLFPDAG